MDTPHGCHEAPPKTVAVRGAVKACGDALPSCTAAAFHRKAAEHIPGGLRPALLPLVEAVGELTARIAAAGREVEALCEAHPETAALRQVTGVGPITALTFVLTIENPGRFPKNREVVSPCSLSRASATDLGWPARRQAAADP